MTQLLASPDAYFSDSRTVWASDDESCMPDEPTAPPDSRSPGSTPGPRAAPAEPSAARTAERAARQQRLAELGGIAGNLAHELKNPLSTLKLNLQLLQEDLAAVPGAESSKNRIATMKKEADRLAQTLDNFLRYAGRIELHKTPARLNGVVQDLVDFFLPQTRAANVRLLASLTPDDPVLSLDINLFKQALLNLLLNAQQAMPAGGDLFVRTHLTDRLALVDVADTGPGIAPEHMPRLFDAYFTTKKGGTGLGLATTRRIIEEHHGHIEVTSEAGRGTNFRLELPLAG